MQPISSFDRPQEYLPQHEWHACATARHCAILLLFVLAVMALATGGK